MSKTLLNIKTDSDVKKEAKHIAKELGLPLSTVVNAYLKEFIRDKSITFSLAPQLRPEVDQMLEQASKDREEGKNTDGPFATPEEVLGYLHA